MNHIDIPIYYHPMIKIIFRSRTVCYLYTLVAMALIFYKQGYSLSLLFLVVYPCILWPQVAYLISNRVQNPTRAEYIFMSIDSFLSGCYIAWAHFNPWFSISLLIFICVGDTSIGGFALLVVCLITLALGMVFSGFLNHYQVNLVSDYWLIGLSILSILFYMSYIGYFVYSRNTNINETKKKLLQANSEITLITQIVKAACSSVNLDEMVPSILPILKTIFTFDTMILQFASDDKDPYQVHTIYSQVLSDIQKERIKPIIVKSRFKGYLFENINENSFISNYDKQLFLFKSFSSILSLPVFLDQKETGLLTFFNYKEPFILNADDINIVKKVCSQIGLVIKNSLLYQKMIEHKEQLNKKKNELEELSNKLSHYLSPQVFDFIFSGKKEAKIESNRKRLTIFFSELYGFSNLTEKIEIETITTILNQYLDEMSTTVLQHGGTLDKYIGDSVMVFFGDPETQGVKQDAIECVLMALDMLKCVEKLYEEWRKLNIPETVKVRMGINSGFCTVGNFGSEYRIDYTLIGGQVNLASRLLSSAKPGTILISEDTYLLVKDRVECEKSEQIHVKGIAHAIQTYRVNKVVNSYGK